MFSPINPVFYQGQFNCNNQIYFHIPIRFWLKFIASHEGSLLKNELSVQSKVETILKNDNRSPVFEETVVAALHCMAIIGPSS